MVPFGKATWVHPHGASWAQQDRARVDVFAKRLQVQENSPSRSVTPSGAPQPQGVAVIMQCQHFCMCYRGVKKPGSWTTTSKLHGVFLNDPASRMELFTLIGLKREIGA